VLVVPGRRFLGVSNPQGRVPAPIGQEFYNEITGTKYLKLGGGFSRWGWYQEPSIADLRSGWFRAVPRGAATPNLYTVGADVQGTIVGGLSGNIFPEGTALDTDRPWKMAYTPAAAAGSTVTFRAHTNVNPMPAIIGQNGADNELGFDWFCDIRTTPRPTSASAPTDLLNLRLGIGALVWNSAIPVIGNSDTFQTYWGGVAANQGIWGAMFRFSTAAADPGWMLVVGNENGAVWSQTITDLGVAVVANTSYRLRLRYVVAPVRTLFASINDGPEVAVTANVGPNVVVSAMRSFQSFVNASTLVAAFKSIGVGGIGARFSNRE